MYIQPLQAIESSGCYHVGGDVTIHPSATIAPGVLIRAEPNCKIAIGSAACVGMGAVIHACEGDITIEAGVSLGAAVLVVGHAVVGSNALVGSSTTIRNCTVERGAVVPAASLLGELGPSGERWTNEAAAVTNHETNGASGSPGLLGDIHSVPACDPATVAPETPSDFPAPEASNLEGASDGDVDVSGNGHVDAASTPSSVQSSSPPPTESPLHSGDSDFTDEPVSNGNSPNGSSPLISGPPIDGADLAQDDVCSVNGADSAFSENGQPISSQASLSAPSAPAENANGSTDAYTSLVAPKPITPKPSPAFGKSQVSRLMKSLFPHSNPYSTEDSNGSSPSPSESEAADELASDPHR